MSLTSVLRPLLIAALVLSEVGLWQWRMVIVYRGKRAGAMLLGAVGAVLQITAISQVVAYVNDPVNVIAYAAGVGLGILAGLVVGDRVSPGSVEITVTSAKSGLAAHLWSHGWPVTETAAHHAGGQVSVLKAAVNRRHEATFVSEVRAFASDAQVSAAETRLFDSVPAPVRQEIPLGADDALPSREYVAVGS